MKIRHGFVSNSSSTSYTVLIKERGKDHPWYGPIEFMTETLLRDSGSSIKDVNDVRKNLEHKLGAAIRDVVFVQEHIRTLKDLEAQKHAISVFLKLQQLAKDKTPNAPKGTYMPGSLSCLTEKPEEMLRWELQKLHDDLQTAQQETENIGQKLEGLSNFNDTDVVLYFEEDNWGWMGRAIERLKEEDLVYILDKVST
jgi:hypothetical protein